MYLKCIIERIDVLVLNESRSAKSIQVTRVSCRPARLTQHAWHVCCTRLALFCGIYEPSPRCTRCFRPSPMTALTSHHQLRRPRWTPFRPDPRGARTRRDPPSCWRRRAASARRAGTRAAAAARRRPIIPGTFGGPGWAVFCRPPPARLSVYNHGRLPRGATSRFSERPGDDGALQASRAG